MTKSVRMLGAATLAALAVTLGGLAQDARAMSPPPGCCDDPPPGCSLKSYTCTYAGGELQFEDCEYWCMN